MARVSNSPYPPGMSHEHSHPHLTTHEAEVIDRLLTACSEYQHNGEDLNSELVDRIGMNMMQAFIARNSEKSDDS
ncbi:hypothetical protein [Celeribacter sp. PS-C1]|uniref:hypothetical protein n=1 Tax=Celeribacter sp. PS-C1 TaxID=2820813 RepID=UPI001CA5344C|nr:hypothetical protein [Celeribacter sp. PS-C1]MBW6419369.1 hypothetical protein [Celeribacter sp. PS-C1]